MRKNDYIWTFDGSSLKSGINGPFSIEYHVSGRKMFVDASKLADSRIWLAVKVNGKHYLYAFITPDCIERYSVGNYKGDFLLHANPYCSVRLLPRVESRDAWLLTNFINEKAGVRKCTNEEKTIFLGKLNQNYRTSFRLPPRSFLKIIPKSSHLDVRMAVPEQLKLVLKNLAFGDIARSKSFPVSVSAYGGIALLLLKESIKDFNFSESVKLIASLDPFSPNSSIEPKYPDVISKTSASLPPAVDTCLEEIDPAKISPRIFIARSKNYSLDWLSKTIEAERDHEKIIKDVTVFLKSKNIKTYKSRSFDLFADILDSKCLWEVKSTNESNIVEQGEKGIIQLLRYSAALLDADSKKTRFMLLLQSRGQIGALSYLSKMAKMAGVELWLYDSSLDWPKRIFNPDTDNSFFSDSLCRIMR